MFVLNPNGVGGAGAVSPGRQKFWFFARLGVYFVALRGTFVFFSGREDRKALLK